MHQAQELFAVEFDSALPPVLEFDAADGLDRVWRVDLDADADPVPPAGGTAQAFTVWFTSMCFDRCAARAAACVRSLLAAEPFATLQIVLDASETESPARSVTPRLLDALAAARSNGQPTSTSITRSSPGARTARSGSWSCCQARLRDELDPDWVDAIGATAAVVWRGVSADAAEMEAFEYAWPG